MKDLTPAAETLWFWLNTNTYAGAQTRLSQ